MAGHDAADVLLIPVDQFHKEIHLSGQNSPDNLLVPRSPPCRPAVSLSQKGSQWLSRKTQTKGYSPL
jgi:hypothetical protein